MSVKKPVLFGLFVLFFAATAATSAQEARPRLAPMITNNVSTTVQQYPRSAPNSSVTINSAARTTTAATIASRPAGTRHVLTNDLLVRPTVSSVAANSGTKFKLATNSATAAIRAQMLGAMNKRLGAPYRMGSEGPYSYDCSGVVWSVFQEAGISFERTSAAALWQKFEPAAEEDQYRFGTLVFFNGLKHVGVVIDENTFFQASSSQGVTFSSFDGYWGKRITGFRRVPLNQISPFTE